MITILDYGIGNLRSVAKALAAVGAQAQISADPASIPSASGIILPGVGAFGDGMDGLRQRGLDAPLLQAARAGKPILGICLGMQLLFERSDESGSQRGLGLIPGRVVSFEPGDIKVPHTGWNQLTLQRRSPLTAGVEPGAYAYFNHGYICAPADPRDVLTLTRYGGRFASAVGRGDLYGVQWHPEKSQALGLQVLGNFAARCRS